MNRLSVFDYKGREEIINYWTFGTKITTYKIQREQFKNELILLKKGFDCKDGINSRLNYDPLLNCICPVLRNAGWHFSSLLNDADLLKKMRSNTGAKIDNTIPNFEAQRSVSSTPLMYLQDFELKDAGLPKELVNDMLINH